MPAKNTPQIGQDSPETAPATTNRQTASRRIRRRNQTENQMNKNPWHAAGNKAVPIPAGMSFDLSSSKTGSLRYDIIA
jgi:hypothetical protein